MVFSRLQFLASCSILITSCIFAQNREMLGEYRIGIVGQDRENSIYQATQLGAMDAAHAISKRDSIDIEVVVLTPDRSMGQDQESSLSKLFINNADGIIISPGTESTTHSAIRFAQEQGQKIIFFFFHEPQKKKMKYAISTGDCSWYSKNFFFFHEFFFVNIFNVT